MQWDGHSEYAMTIINPTREGTDSRIIAVTAFPNATNAMMLAALCFDRLYSIAAPHHYNIMRNMTKRKGYVLVLAIWLLSFSLSFISFFDPQINGTKTIRELFVLQHFTKTLNW